ncbi:MAG: hypothetical protein HYX75_02025 [Acidobacteria bacterium]|nr:hypothetical protein [Acidobacteriota bacterium]
MRSFFFVPVAGQHTTPSDDKKSSFDIQGTDGPIQNVRVDLAFGLLKGQGKTKLASPQAEPAEMRTLKPIGPDKVRDSARVRTEEITSLGL